MNAGIRLAVALTALPQALTAQGLLEQFSYEGLRFSGIGFEVGVVAPNRVTTELTGAVRIDYGLIAPRIRVLIGASYFKGDFDADEILQFENKLRRVVDDPTGDFSIDVGTITWSDFEADLDLQYVLEAGQRVTTFLGLGLAVHIRNGSGSAIEDTFVEDALDTIEAGLNLSLGTQVQLVPTLYLTVDLRGGLSSELRTAAARAGLMYRVPR